MDGFQAAHCRAHFDMLFRCQPPNFPTCSTHSIRSYFGIALKKRGQKRNGLAPLEGQLFICDRFPLAAHYLEFTRFVWSVGSVRTSFEAIAQLYSCVCVCALEVFCLWEGPSCAGGPLCAARGAHRNLYWLTRSLLLSVSRFLHRSSKALRLSVLHTLSLAPWSIHQLAELPRWMSSLAKVLISPLTSVPKTLSSPMFSNSIHFQIGSNSYSCCPALLFTFRKRLKTVILSGPSLRPHLTSSSVSTSLLISLAPRRRSSLSWN